MTISGGNHYFKKNIIWKLNETFKFGAEEMSTFTYIRIRFQQNADHSTDIAQHK